MTKNLYAALQAPDIAPFVNWTKFVRSAAFDALATGAVEHFQKHGDSTFIKALVMPLAQHAAFHGTLVWLCRRAGLSFGFNQNDLVLKRLSADAPPPPSLAVDAALREFTGTMARVRSSHALRERRADPSSSTTRDQAEAREGRRGSWFVQGGAPGLGRRS